MIISTLEQPRHSKTVLQPYSIKVRYDYLNIGATTFKDFKFENSPLRIRNVDPFKFMNCPKVHVSVTIRAQNTRWRVGWRNRVRSKFCCFK
jgi:hypothetical protein